MPRRARDQAAKEARRGDLLDAAAALFVERAFPEITITLVAERAGVAKGTVYLYFKTKEELFLHLALDRLAEWFGALDAELATLAAAGEPDSPAALARVIAATLGGRPDLRRLLGILHMTLEGNIGPEEAGAFKRRLRDLMLGAAAHLAPHLPGLPPEGAFRFLLWLHALVVGLSQAAAPSAAVRSALEAPDLAVFRIDFERELEEALTLLLAGAAARGAAPAG